MIEFMVLGLPRSGTAWLANLLTTDDTFCWHEALWSASLKKLDYLPYQGRFGISETSGFAHLEQLNAHPSRKIIIDRPLDEINKSLIALDLPTMRDEEADLHSKLEGYRIKFSDIFDYDRMSMAYNYVLSKKLNVYRFNMLVDMNIQNTTVIQEIKDFLP